MNSMTRFTEKTIRTETQWVKITRDNESRTFTFARGYNAEFSAHDISTLSFKWIPNWTEAIDRANRSMETYA
jgi:hypothetical protein